MTEAELITVVTQELMGLADRFETHDFTNAVDKAENETGWTMPVSTDFKILWMQQRVKRHLIEAYLFQVADKFDYKQAKLSQRYKNFSDMLKTLDDDFKEIQEQNVAEFANVDTYKMFGTKIDAGFVTEAETGRDLTYNTDQEVIITPEAE